MELLGWAVGALRLSAGIFGWRMAASARRIEAREAYVRKRLEDRRLGHPPTDVPQAGGRWERTIDRRAADGSTVSVRVDPEILRTLAEILVDCGARTELAANGDEALARLVATEFDLVFCDMRMPGLDGTGLYRAVAARMPDLARRFVFVTGDLLSVEVAGFLKETAAPHIEKPFRRDEILRTGLSVLERS